MKQNDVTKMTVVLTKEEKEYLMLNFKIDNFYNECEVLENVNERIETLKSLLDCVDDEHPFLRKYYLGELKGANDIRNKMIYSRKVKKEIMKNALDMYIRDTSEKIMFIHENLGNDSGMMKHFKNMLDAAKEIKSEIIKG